MKRKTSSDNTLPPSNKLSLPSKMSQSERILGKYNDIPQGILPCNIFVTMYNPGYTPCYTVRYAVTMRSQTFGVHFKTNFTLYVIPCRPVQRVYIVFVLSAQLSENS